jgi:hypothetical protein
LVFRWKRRQDEGSLEDRRPSGAKVAREAARAARLARASMTPPTLSEARDRHDEYEWEADLKVASWRRSSEPRPPEDCVVVDCPFCFAVGGSTIRLTVKRFPYSTCRVCGTTCFLNSLAALKTLRQRQPGVVDRLVAATPWACF